MNRTKRKVHVSLGNGLAYCDSNISGKTISSTGSKDICNNCLQKLSKEVSPYTAARIELKFHFTQYTGGSEFLDSIRDQLRNGFSMSSKQYSTALKVFRSNHFKHNVNDLKGLY